MIAEFVVTLWKDQVEYNAMLLSDGRLHFCDGTGWVDPNPIPDEIVAVRPVKSGRKV